MPLKSFTIPLYLIFLVVIFLNLNHSLALSELSNDITVNCGSSSIFNGNDGRKWIGDIGSKLLVTSQYSEAKLIRSKLAHLPDMIPYTTARISYKQFTYETDVGAGQKFIRLYFYPSMYKGFERSNDLFTVKAGEFTLLSNFSASVTVDALGVNYLMKEFCVNVEKHQLLTITFSPSTGGAKGKAYAFVNAIEIISIPTGLYYTPVGEPAMYVVGKKHQLSVDESIALEMVYRLNMGGSSISSVEDTGFFREWSDDSKFFVNSDVRPVSTSNRIRYKSTASYSAPQKVYQTSWATVLTKQAYKGNNFTWKLPVDLGFRYLLRFHFCELEYDIEENSYLRFSIVINDHVAEANADLIKWSGGSGIAISRDYVAVMEGDRMEGKRDLLISLTPRLSNNEEWWTESTDTILKGLEVFKLSNTDNNLAGINPVPMTRALSSNIRNPRKFVYANGGSAISTIVMILISLVSIIVYQLRIMGENNGDEKLSISPSKGVSCRFSLAEIRTATNNFDELLIIGRGGFGFVYKGEIDGAITVALKRLNSKSKQGADEFWTEIDMLSKLRHTHLVSLIGYCNEEGEMILVYEYMEHGTLADHLHKISTNGGGSLDLTWEQKLKICIGAARGLDYLHTGTPHGVIHRDVKSTNILLDNKLVAKISDFGLCKVGPTSHSYTHVSTNVKGTFGYFDPEYFLTHRLTKKSDVYAFGVVLLEVLCGRKAVDLSFGEDRCSLALWAQQCIKEGKINELIGPSLQGKISFSCLKIFAEVAYKCIHNRPNVRPTMFDVVVSLEGALTSQNLMSDIVQLDSAPQQGTIPSSTTHIRDVENIQQEKKRSKGMLFNAFQWSLLRLPTKMSSGSTSDDERNNHHLPYRRFTIKEIRAATNGFDSNLRIYEDSFGVMYKGRIDHGTLKVTIKSIKKPLDADDLLTSRSEIKAQTQLNHLNIISLLGYCTDRDNLMLVYNYMVNKSLDYNLYKARLHNPLPWTKRLEICIGAAKGLQYLHYGTTKKIIHRDITPSNILLDENWVARISGFELSKVAAFDHMSTCVRGTNGFIDPEYAFTGQLTEKTDVYAFGGVLLEVMCVRKPYTPSQDEEKHSLVRWFRTCIQLKKIYQLIDPYLIGRISPECFMQYLKVTWDCLLDLGTKRPTMNSVVHDLQIALQLQQIWHTDRILSVNGRDYNNILASQHSSFFDHSGIYVQDKDLGDTDPRLDNLNLP